MARRRKRRRINKGRVAALLIIILVIAAGIFFVTTRFGRTSYASVNKSMGEYMVKANDDLLGKGTDKELKKSLYVPRKIDKTKKLIAFTFDDGPHYKNTKEIMAEFDYPGIRMMIEANLERMRQPFKIDISTDDAITPGAVEYKY